MSENKNENVVIALYANVEVAETAVAALKDWDKANDDVKLGAVGTLVATPDGKIKTHVGRKTGKGAKVGAIVGIVAGVFTGGATVIAGLVGGSMVGGAMGTFFKKSTHLTEDEVNKIAEELKSGKVAVVVTCDDFEVEATKDYLEMAGGTVWTYQVPAEALVEAASLAEPVDEIADAGQKAKGEGAATGQE